VISLSTSQAGDVLTLTVSDNAPGDMCSGGFCGADFAIDYDPGQLEFLDVTASDFFAMANAPSGGQVLVTMFADPDSFPGTNVLFSLGFRALVGGQAALTIGPRDFGVPVGGAYMPDPATIQLDVVGPAAAVPEPNTALLVALALAGLAWRRRTFLAQDRRPVPLF
jgi:hypothetical protein